MEFTSQHNRDKPLVDARDDYTALLNCAPVLAACPIQLAQMPTQMDVCIDSQTMSNNPTVAKPFGQSLGPSIVKGFTLIEMLIAVTIFAILTAIAIPAYDNYTNRSYRTELMGELLVCGQAIERFNAINFTYVGVTTDGAANGALDPTLCPLNSVTQGRYTVTVTTTVNTYTLTAVPTGVMAGDGNITLAESGARTWDEAANGVGAGDFDWLES